MNNMYGWKNLLAILALATPIGAGAGACASDLSAVQDSGDGGDGGVMDDADGDGDGSSSDDGSPPEANFTSDNATAAKFGVHEISLQGQSTSNDPFDVSCNVEFVPQSDPSQTRTVVAFYDGNDTWRARTYVSQPGPWSWSSQCDDPGLDGRSGSFVSADSFLPGMLRPHASNPRHWMTDNGRTFLNIADTAYKLFHPESLADDYQTFVAEDAALGVTSIRAMLFGEWDWDLYWSDGDMTGGDRLHPSLDSLQRTDMRLRWMLDNHPEVVVQLVLFVDGVWSVTVDDPFWRSLSDQVRTRLMDHIISRFAAYPNVYWEVTNDTGLASESQTPDKWFWATDVGTYFKTHDPWSHLMAYGHTRDSSYPFLDASWSSYVVAYTGYDIACDFPEDQGYDQVPKHTYNTEDYYETYNPPTNPFYFYRRLMWSYLLSGMSATYAGTWDDIVPYSQTGHEGLDGIAHIVSFLNDNGVDLAEYEPDDALAEQQDAPGPEGNQGPSRPQATRSLQDSSLVVYVPNALPGEQTGYVAASTNAAEHTREQAALDTNKTVVVRVDLRDSSGTFHVLWMRATDGVMEQGDPVQAGQWQTLTAPWSGVDVALCVHP